MCRLATSSLCTSTYDYTLRDFPFLFRGFCHGIYTFTLHSTKPDLHEIMKFMCQLAALFSEWLMLCDSID